MMIHSIAGVAPVTSERVERKLTTILAADIADYSRPTGVDEEGTMRRIRALRTDRVDR
jgi:adenylate cyclase